MIPHSEQRLFGGRIDQALQEKNYLAVDELIQTWNNDFSVEGYSETELLETFIYLAEIKLLCKPYENYLICFKQLDEATEKFHKALKISYPSSKMFRKMLSINR
jgi:hypothetical protein